MSARQRKPRSISGECWADNCGECHERECFCDCHLEGFGTAEAGAA